MIAKPFTPLVGPGHSHADVLAAWLEEAARRLGTSGELVADIPEQTQRGPLSDEKRAAIVREYQARMKAGRRVSLVTLARDFQVHPNTARKLTRHFRLSKPVTRKNRIR